jgi:branched-chain amino acid aminotransferase
MSMRAWVNGQVLDGEQPALLANDHGITVGDGVFETCKVNGGEVFAMSRHLRRLVRSATGLGLAEPDTDLVRRGVAELLAAQGPIEFGRLRITVTGGPGPLGSERTGTGLTYVIQAVAQDRPPATTAAVVAPWVRNERSPVAGLKTTSYAENVMALAYAKERGASEALMANTVGELCEGTGSNVVLAIDGSLVTPPLAGGALPGITRGLLLEWAAEAGLVITERPVALGELADATEVLLTSSIRDVQPVHALDGRELAAPGPLGQVAVDLFAQRAGKDIDP